MRSRGKRKARPVLVVLLVGILALTGFILVQRARLPQLGPLVSMLDSAEAAGGWTMVSERTTPPLLICLGASPCPSAHRNWSGREGYTVEDFRADVATLGWSLTAHKVCSRPMTIQGRSCSLHGVVDGVDVSLFYDFSGQGADDAAVSVGLSLKYKQGSE